MKIGLITAIREDIDLPYEVHFKRGMSNLAPMYLAAYLEKHHPHHEIQIKDSLKDFKNFVPDLIGISSTTENINYASWIAKKAKAQWGCICVLGGVHISILPHTLSEEFDFGVMGEGEIIFKNLIETLEQKEISSSDFKGIQGLVYRDHGEIVKNQAAETLSNLDVLPYPKREKYIDRVGQFYIMTSRGCPYKCSFCVIPALNGSYRMHGDDHVIEELKSIRKHFPEVKSIRIYDDLFVANKKRVARLAQKISDNSLSENFKFSCWGRANIIDESLVESLKLMNIVYVAFGAESGSDALLQKIKASASVAENQYAIDLLSENKIFPSCSFLLGHPEENEEDMMKTFSFIEKNKDKFLELELNVAIPWPGTALWEVAKDKGLVSDFMDFDLLKEAGYFPHYSVNEYPYLNDNMSPERFSKILEEFKELWSEVNGSKKRTTLLGEMGWELHSAKLK